MIEVPVRVKDALRSGEYRKNVKITVPGVNFYKKTFEGDSQHAVNPDTGSTVRWTGRSYFNPLTQKWWSEYWGKYWLTQSFAKIEIAVKAVADDTLSFISFDNIEYRNFKEKDGKIYVEIFNPAIGEHNIKVCVENYNGREPLYDLYPTYIYGYVEWHEIDNNNLVSESVKFDERMCSDSNLKFGLCEGTSVEFQYFDLPSILGQNINIKISVEYKNESGNLAWYEIPMGYFDVEECSKQASTGIIKAVAYNKLKSAYLDQNMNITIKDIVDTAGSSGVVLESILSNLLDGFGISQLEEVHLLQEYTGYLDPIPSSYFEYHAWGIPKANSSGQRIYDGKRLVVLDLTIHIPLVGLVYGSDKFYKFIINSTSGDYSDNAYLERIRAAGVDPNQNIWNEEIGYYSSLLSYMRTSSNTFNFSYYFSGSYEIELVNGNKDLSRKMYFYRGTYDTGYRDNISLSYEKCLVTLHCPVAVYELELNDYQKALDMNHQLDANLQLDYVIDREGFRSTMETVGRQIWDDKNLYMSTYYSPNISEISSMIIYPSDVDSITDEITLRDLQSAVFEINCQYGKLDRVTDLFAGIELNNASLQPRDGLYPNNGLYPMGQSESGYPAMYSKLWADEGNVHKFRYLIITYKGTENGQEVEKKLQRTVYADGTDDYNMSDNWLFRNLVWTDVQIGTYADAMVAKMRNISWFPFEMWCAGLPYLESGDAIEIQMREGAYKSYVLRRSLSGIQNLQDEMINGTLDIF